MYVTHVLGINRFRCVRNGPVESAAVVGGLSALGAALYSSGIPKDSIIAYESAIKADGFLVTVHGPAEELDRAKATR